jgi:hypothetical protein
MTFVALPAWAKLTALNKESDILEQLSLLAARPMELCFHE